MKRVYILLACFGLAFTAAGQNFSVRTVKNNLFIPWEIIYGPDDNIWLTQKNGFICRLDPVNGNTDTLYHETNTVIQNEGGMLGMAIHPSFPAQPYVYVAYEYSQGGYKERIVRYTYYNTGDSLGSPMILLDNITGSNIHNGCRLAIVGDKLFITTGDAANQPSAQNVNSLNGKILRINLDGSIPSDNPLASNPAWSWGERNSQGIVYANNTLYTSMHGASNDDEINIIKKGRNYGWPTVEGYCNQQGEMSFCTDSNVVEPIYTWSPTIAASGMDYYNHPMFPQWQNSLAMGTLKDESLYFLKLDANYDSIITEIKIDTLNIGRIRDICISPDGSIFLSTSNSPSGGTGAKTDRIVELYDSTYIPTKVKLQATGQLSIYPNPTKDEITFSLRNTAIAGMAYTVTNSLGQVALQGRVTSATLSLRTLPAGIYQLMLRDNKGHVYTGKIIRE